MKLQKSLVTLNLLPILFFCTSFTVQGAVREVRYADSYWYRHHSILANILLSRAPHAKWSSTGTYVTRQMPNSPEEILVLDDKGEKIAQLMGRANTVVWAPQGPCFAYETDGAALLFNCHEETVQILFESETISCARITWAPSGNMLVWSGFANDRFNKPSSSICFIYHVESDQAFPLLLQGSDVQNPKINNIYEISWSLSEKYLLCQMNGCTAEKWNGCAIPSDDKHPRTLTRVFDCYGNQIASFTNQV